MVVSDTRHIHLFINPPTRPSRNGHKIQFTQNNNIKDTHAHTHSNSMKFLTPPTNRQLLVLPTATKDSMRLSPTLPTMPSDWACLTPIKPSQTKQEQQQEQQQQQQPEQPNKKRTVRFASGVRVKTIKSCKSMDAATKSNVYCGRHEMEKVRKGALAVAQAVYEKDQILADSNCYSFTMWEAYEACVRASESGNDQVSPEDSEAIQRCNDRIRQSGSRRGLERLTIPALSRARREIRKKAVRSVLWMQEQTVEGVPLRENPEIMAHVYEQTSRPAKLYARVLGEADEAAVQHKSQKKAKKEKKHHKHEKKEDEEKKKKRKQTTKSHKDTTKETKSRKQMKKSKSEKLHASRECRLVQREISPKRISRSCRELFQEKQSKE